MGRQIIKKDNGKYAIWSTVVDDFLFDDITEEEWTKFRIEESIEETKKSVQRYFEEVKEGIHKNNPFAMTYEEACKTRDEVHNEGD